MNQNEIRAFYDRIDRHIGPPLTAAPPAAAQALLNAERALLEELLEKKTEHLEQIIIRLHHEQKNQKFFRKTEYKLRQFTKALFKK